MAKRRKLNVAQCPCKDCEYDAENECWLMPSAAMIGNQIIENPGFCWQCGTMLGVTEKRTTSVPWIRLRDDWEEIMAVVNARYEEVV